MPHPLDNAACSTRGAARTVQAHPRPRGAHTVPASTSASSFFPTDRARLHRAAAGATQAARCASATSLPKRAPVPSDCGLSLMPTSTFATPAAGSRLRARRRGGRHRRRSSDRETIEFVRRQAAQAKYVTSVCTGAFVLGAAGCCAGAALRRTGPTRAPAAGRGHLREGEDRQGRQLHHGGGVTSGIDFALRVAAEIAGEGPRAIQLCIEYDPAPPFDGGASRSRARGCQIEVDGPVTRRSAPRWASR